MPNFYAKQILDTYDHFCVGTTADSWVKSFYSWFAWSMCKSVADYKLEKDKDGNPTIESCMKNDFGGFYDTKEAYTLFRAIYTN
jgi:hypothetical protein